MELMSGCLRAVTSRGSLLMPEMGDDDTMPALGGVTTQSPGGGTTDAGNRSSSVGVNEPLQDSDYCISI